MSQPLLQQPTTPLASGRALATTNPAELLLSHLSGAAEAGGAALDAIIHAYGPQLGEMAWHSVHLDPGLEGIVAAQGEAMRALIQRYRLQPTDRPIRILEVGAYSHYTVHQVAAELGGIGIANDISPAALRVGVGLARDKNITVGQAPVASDFHDLPFSSGYFDLVFIASAIHHTFRPWVVLDELFRVVRPGGVLHLANEPVGRTFCLYQFRCNREDGATAFEQAIAARGLTRILSSPFPGSRPEEMFGMIENDRIPLGIYLHAFARNGETLALELDHECIMGPLDHAALALPRDARLAERLHDLLAPRLREAAVAYTSTDLLLGFSLPRREQLWQLCYATADALRRLPAPGDPSYRMAAAALFGAALKGSFRRTGGTASDVALRRALPVEDGVMLDFPEPAALGLDLHDRRLPDIATAEDAEIAQAFPAEHWQRHLEPAGSLSVINLTVRPVITLPVLPSGGLLLMRYYAAMAGRPYLVRFIADGQLLATQVIAQPESRLARILLPAGATRLLLELCAPDGTPITETCLLHLSVAQLMPLRGATGR